MTVIERLCAGLVRLGWTETDDYQTRKYRVFKPPADNDYPTSRYFVGRFGGLRYSQGGNVTQSFPHKYMKAHLLDLTK